MQDKCILRSTNMKAEGTASDFCYHGSTSTFTAVVDLRFSPRRWTAAVPQSVQRLATGGTTERSRIFTSVNRPAWLWSPHRPHSLPSSECCGIFPLEKKRPGRGTAYSPPTSAEVKKKNFDLQVQSPLRQVLSHGQLYLLPGIERKHMQSPSMQFAVVALVGTD
jgi:hypothetical protein